MSDPEQPDDLARLRALPQHDNHANPSPAARAAFDRAFGRKPASGALEFAVPVGLLGVVGVYLLWAFGAAIALYH